MNSEQWVQDVARRARQENLPRLDVAAQVAARIHRPRANPWDPMLIMAGSAAAAAVIIVVHAASAFSTLSDPFTMLFAPLNAVLR